MRMQATDAGGQHPPSAPELIDKINAPVVKRGHEIAGSKPGEPLLAHADSFVAECDTHHPTDVNLLRDATVAALRIVGQQSPACGLTIWRQWQHRTENVLSAGASFQALVDAGAFVKCAKTFVDQTRRRVFLGETIPRDEKIFSVFEPHTRWISKGKAGRPVELGVPASILVDRLGFDLQCEIMREGTDVDQSAPLVERAREKHPDLGAVGLDRGFRSPENRKRLEELLDCAALPKKGRPSEEDKARERSPQFAEMCRLAPSGGIADSNLEHRCLDRVLSCEPDGFARMTALSMVAANIHRIGLIEHRRDLEDSRRRNRRRAA